MEYKYYLAQLEGFEAELYSFICGKLTERAERFSVDASVEVIDRTVKAIMLDNPELFWFEGKWRAVFEDGGVCVIPEYKHITDHGYINSLIEQAVSDITSECHGDGAESIRLVYDRLIRDVEYCLSANDQTVEGAFVDRRAVCKGIAKAFQLLMNRLDIPSFLIEGTLDGQALHIWNVVYADGEFYHVDVTMGYAMFTPMFHGLDRNRHYPCFMVSDKTISATHRIYTADPPACAVDYDTDKLFVRQLAVPDSLKRYGEMSYLDRGATCTVLKVRGNNAVYALKAMDATAAAYAELEKLQALSDCTGIVRLTDSGYSKESRRLFMLMPYCKPLTKRRKEKDFNTADKLLSLGRDILNTLTECRNRGIYHLDIQPKNIYFDNNGKALLGDFGNAVFADELHSLKPKRGTLAFMAPEVYSEGVYGQASEIYSLGIVLYSLLNKAMLPFSEGNDGSTAIRLRLEGNSLPPPYGGDERIRKWVLKMCAFSPTQRFATYEEALAALDDI